MVAPRIWFQGSSCALSLSRRSAYHSFLLQDLKHFLRRCLVKSLVLVLVVIWEAETRSRVRALHDECDHRVIEANGFSQAELLLTKWDAPRACSHGFFVLRFGRICGILRCFSSPGEARAYRIVRPVNEKSAGSRFDSITVQWPPMPVTVIEIESIFGIVARNKELLSKTVTHKPDITTEPWERRSCRPSCFCGSEKTCRRRPFFTPLRQGCRRLAGSQKRGLV
jgi:hypothetical protein